MTIDVALVGPEQHEALTFPLRVAFGLHLDPERAARHKKIPELVQRIAAFDSGKIVGSAGAFLFKMTVPGGVADVSGLTLVGVLPSHRRQGLLTRMMRMHFGQARENGLPISALWATEGGIYGRFGYGVSTFSSAISIDREWTRFKKASSVDATFSILDENEAMEPFRSAYERARLETPGMISRSDAWWAYRRLGDYEKGQNLMVRVLMRINGQPEGYALYRVTERSMVPGPVENIISVGEAVATSPEATAALWRFLFDLDLIKRIDAPLLHPNHPLLHLLLEPRRLRMVTDDAVWVRLVDVEAALSKRTLGTGAAVTIRVDDPFCPWNEGNFRIEEGKVKRTDSAPEARLPIASLGSMFLGGVTAGHLAAAREIEELVPGAIQRLESIFRWHQAPWCPEIF
ncbi:MAG: GNAT family N-acetyltransferase [Polyangiaceae bacterium]|nr:GNAT family N-acetyltransferase [Polyangiaceae bacterium]